MTTGFDPFELPTCGLLQGGWDHSRPKACFYLRSPALDWLSQYYKYTIAKQNGGGTEWVELFITLTMGMGEPTYGFLSHPGGVSVRLVERILYQWFFLWILGAVSRIIILCVSCSQRALNGGVLLLVTAYLT